MRIGSLCSGYAGLEMGVQAVIGGTVAWHVENDPNASKILAHHWPDISNHGDLTTVGWATVEPVEVLTAGYPCQPFSHAGKRKGTADERHLWPFVAGAISALRPRLVVLENVRGHVSMGLDAVVGDLSALGYDARWCVVRAADAGAPHGRARVFILAVDATGTGPQGPAWGWIQHGLSSAGHRRLVTAADTACDGRDEGRSEPARLIGGPDATERGRAVAPAADRDGLQGERWQHPLRRDTDGRDSENRDGDASEPATTADTDRGERDGWQREPQRLSLERATPTGPGEDVHWGTYEPAIRRWEHVLGRLAPSPTEPGAKGQPRLSPRFVEWMQGIPAGHVTDVAISRNAQLKALGNGVVPQQAALALGMLLGALARAA